MSRKLTEWRSEEHQKFMDAMQDKVEITPPKTLDSYRIVSVPK